MDEDADFLLALELSRKEEEARQKQSKHVPPASEVIEILDSDDEDDISWEQMVSKARNKGKQRAVASKPAPKPEDSDAKFQAELEKAIAASKTEVDPDSQAGPSRPAISNRTSKASLEQQPTPQPKATPQPSVSMFLTERAKLERERLARLKRLRPDVDPEAVEEDKSDDDDETPPAKRAKPSAATPSTSTIKVSAQSSTSNGPFFWEGELRQIANRHAVATKDQKPIFRLTEILGDKPQEIKFLIFSTYASDMDWLLRVMPTNTPIIMIAQPGPDGNATVHNILPNWIKTAPFLANGRGCMHMKFMLVFYSTGRLRIMITTANFIDYDWRDIENTAWVQDVPLREKSIPDDPKADDFPAHLQSVLGRLNFAPALRSHLKGDHAQLPLREINELRRRWDWSKVQVKLVASIAGKFEGRREVAKSGHTALRKAIQDLGAACPSGKDLTIECQGSSIGTYSSPWLNEIYYSARGQSLESWFNYKQSQPRGKMPFPTRLKILFPSLSTVDNSVLGRPGGGTMFCRSQQWNGKTFPRQLFHDSNSKRGGVLMHAKMILGLFSDKPKSMMSKSSGASKGKGVSDDPSEDSKGVGGWCYVGSHNFTPSAWGTLSGSASEPVLNVTNYELGIVFPLPTENADRAGSDIVCWERPPRKYTNTDEPWMQDKHM